MLKDKYFLIGLLLVVFLLWPLLNTQFFTHHDDVQVIRLHQMVKCFEDFQIPCRWVPDLGGLYGYPLFNYYAPLPYYFGAIIYFLSNSLIFSVKTMFAISFIGSFIFMYLFASKFWGKQGGVLSAIFYAYAPYHALDFYVRGAMGEMWGLFFFPAVCLSLVNLHERISIKNSIFFAFSFFFLIISHNLSTMIYTPIILVLIVLFFIKNKIKRYLAHSLIGFIMGVLLSSFYLLPVLFEKDLVHVDTTTYGYFSYTEHFKGLRKLFLDRSWGYGASVREVPGGEKDGISYQIGWVHLIGLILALYTAKKLWQSDKWVSCVIISSTVIVMFAIFMIHPLSLPVWKLLDEFIRFIQFPWRLLMVIIFFTSFLSGAIFLLDLKLKKFIFTGLIILVVLLNFSYFKPEKFLNVNDAELLSGENWERQIRRSIYDYLPKSAKEPPAVLAKERYQVLTGDSRIFDFEEGTNWLKFKAQTNTHTIIRLSQYYFPEWKIFVDGKETNVEYSNNSLGLMTILLGRGEHLVEGRLYDTSVRTISNIISLASFLVISLIFILQFKIVHKWIEYYRKRIN